MLRPGRGSVHWQGDRPLVEHGLCERAGERGEDVGVQHVVGRRVDGGSHRPRRAHVAGRIHRSDPVAVSAGAGLEHRGEQPRLGADDLRRIEGACRGPPAYLVGDDRQRRGGVGPGQQHVVVDDLRDQRGRCGRGDHQLSHRPGALVAGGIDRGDPEGLGARPIDLALVLRGLVVGDDSRRGRLRAGGDHIMIHREHTGGKQPAEHIVIPREAGRDAGRLRGGDREARGRGVDGFDQKQVARLDPPVVLRLRQRRHVGRGAGVKAHQRARNPVDTLADLIVVAHGVGHVGPTQQHAIALHRRLKPRHIGDGWRWRRGRRYAQCGRGRYLTDRRECRDGEGVGHADLEAFDVHAVLIGHDRGGRRVRFVPDHPVAARAACAPGHGTSQARHTDVDHVPRHQEIQVRRRSGNSGNQARSGGGERQTVFDEGVLAGVVGHGGHVDLRRVRLGEGDHLPKFGLNLGVAEQDQRAGYGRLRQGRCKHDLVAGDAGYRLLHQAPVGQENLRREAAGCRRRCVECEGEQVCGHVQHPSAHAHACARRVAGLDDVARRQIHPVHRAAKRHRLGLQTLRVQQPLAQTMRLAAAGAAQGAHLGGDDAVLGHQRVVLHVLDDGGVAVIRVVPRHLRHGVARAQAGALVGERAACDIGRREHHHRIGRRILADVKRTCAPIDDGPKNGGHVLHGSVGVLLRGQQQIAGKARLEPTEAIGHRLVAVLADGVERPFVDAARIDQSAQAVAFVGEQVVEAPSRVVGPGQPERAVPGSGVAARGRVIVARDLHDQAPHVVGPRRDVIELHGVDGDGRHRGVRVGQARVGHQRERVKVQIVGQERTARVWRQARDLDLPRPRSRQGDQVVAGVLARGLAVEAVTNDGDEAAAVGVERDLKGHRRAADIAGFSVRVGQRRCHEGHAQGIDVGCRDGLHDGCGLVDLRVDRDRVLRVGASVACRVGHTHGAWRAGGVLEHEAVEVPRAVGVL